MENPNNYTLCAQIGAMMLCTDLYENSEMPKKNKRGGLYTETDSGVQMEALKSLMMSSFMP